MTRMDEAEKLLDLIGQIYEAGADPARWPEFLAAACGVFAARLPNLTVIDPRKMELIFGCLLGFDQTYMTEYLPRSREDPWMPVGLRQHPGTVLIGSEVVDLNWVRTTDFYHDILRRFEYEWGLATVLKRDASQFAYFSLWRERQQPDFTEADRAAMAHLVPHLQRALFLNRRLAEADARDQAMEEALRRSPHGVVAVDELGHIYYANPRAEAMLRAGDGLAAPQGVICCAHPDDHERLRAGLRAAAWIGGASGGPAPLRRTQGAGRAGGGAISGNARGAGRSGGSASRGRHAPAPEPPPLLRIQRPSGRPGYQAQICPLPVRSDRRVAPAWAVALVFLHDPTTHPVPTVEALRIAYGFTPAEARICELLLQDLTIREVEERLQITENTRKTHLRNIFTKCEVNSQAALIRVLLFGLGTKEVVETAAVATPAPLGGPG